MVERETLETVIHTGNAYPIRAVRQASGRWSVEIAVDFVIHVEDGREVHIRRHVRTQSTEQRGRRNGHGSGK